MFSSPVIDLLVLIVNSCGQHPTYQQLSQIVRKR